VTCCGNDSLLFEKIGGRRQVKTFSKVKTGMHTKVILRSKSKVKKVLDNYTLLGDAED